MKGKLVNELLLIAGEEVVVDLALRSLFPSTEDKNHPFPVYKGNYTGDLWDCAEEEYDDGDDNDDDDENKEENTVLYTNMHYFRVGQFVSSLPERIAEGQTLDRDDYTFLKALVYHIKETQKDLQRQVQSLKNNLNSEIKKNEGYWENYNNLSKEYNKLHAEYKKYKADHPDKVVIKAEELKNEVMVVNEDSKRIEKHTRN